ncbi:MAG: hypothetical protein QG597_4616, partial [Actinomycetota bacterium]|nr:hypothetical protein [Actinomycetota bacterium]
MGADVRVGTGAADRDAPDYLAALAQIWRGDDDPAPLPVGSSVPSPAGSLEAADALAAGLVDLIGRMTNLDPATPEVTAAAIDAAYRHGDPAWAAAARGVVACYWLQLGEEPAAIAELVLAE